MNTTILCLCLMTNIVFANAPAQRQVEKKDLGIRPRGLIIPSEKSGLIIKLYRNSRDIDTAKKVVFRSDDSIRVFYITNIDAYVYLINSTKKGIFILNTNTDLKARANVPYDLELTVDGEVGREELVILLSPKPIAKLEAAVKTTSKALSNFVIPKASQVGFNSLLKNGQLAVMRVPYDHIE